MQRIQAVWLLYIRYTNAFVGFKPVRIVRFHTQQTDRLTDGQNRLLRACAHKKNAAHQYKLCMEGISTSRDRKGIASLQYFIHLCNCIVTNSIG